MDEHLLLTEPRLFGRVERRLAQMERPPFDFGVVDEAQDIGVAELRFLAALGAGRPDALFFPVTSVKGPDAVLLASLGGRHPRPLAHLAGQLPHRPSDPATGGPAAATRDLGRGRQHRPASRHRLRIQWLEPAIQVLPSYDAETAAIAERLKSRGQEGYAPAEMGVFVRSKAELGRAIAAVGMAGYAAVDLAQHAGGVCGNVAVGTMHLAKGVEFRAVAVAACDYEVLSSQARIERVGDQAELDEVYTTERHLLYVACTRARDHLLVTGVEPASEFLDDLFSEH